VLCNNFTRGNILGMGAEHFKSWCLGNQTHAFGDLAEVPALSTVVSPCCPTSSRKTFENLHQSGRSIIVDVNKRTFFHARSLARPRPWRTHLSACVILTNYILRVPPIADDALVSLRTAASIVTFASITFYITLEIYL